MYVNIPYMDGMGSTNGSADSIAVSYLPTRFLTNSGGGRFLSAKKHLSGHVTF